MSRKLKVLDLCVVPAGTYSLETVVLDRTAKTYAKGLLE